MTTLKNAVLAVVLLVVSSMACSGDEIASPGKETGHPYTSPSLTFFYPHDFKAGSFILINTNQGAPLPSGEYFVVDNHVPWLAIIPENKADKNIKEDQWIWVNLLAVPYVFVENRRH